MSVVRARSRTIEARARRSSRRSTPRNGSPASRPSAPSTNGDASTAARRTQIDEPGPGEAGRPRIARPGEQARDADHDEHADQPAQPRPARRRRVDPVAQGLDRRDRAGPSGGLDGGGDRDAERDRDHRHDRGRARVDSLERDRRDRPQVDRHQLREEQAGADSDDATKKAEDHGLDDDECHELATGRARCPEQAELADPLGDGHRQRVEDQEGAHEQGDGGDQRRGRAEVRGRAAQGARDVGRATTGRTARWSGRHRSRSRPRPAWRLRRRRRRPG